MKSAKYRITVERHGEFVHREGDIVGIDKKVWVPFRPDTYCVTNLKTGTTYNKEFATKYQARKFIQMKKEKSK